MYMDCRMLNVTSWFCMIMSHCSSHLNLSPLLLLINVSLHFQYLSTIYVIYVYLCHLCVQMVSVLVEGPDWCSTRACLDESALGAATAFSRSSLSGGWDLRLAGTKQKKVMQKNLIFRGPDNVGGIHCHVTTSGAPHAQSGPYSYPEKDSESKQAPRHRKLTLLCLECRFQIGCAHFATRVPAM